MDLRRLEYFLAVVEHGRVTAAATELHVAQPSLSQAIRALERDVGENAEVALAALIADHDRFGALEAAEIGHREVDHSLARGRRVAVGPIDPRGAAAAQPLGLDRVGPRPDVIGAAVAHRSAVLRQIDRDRGLDVAVDTARGRRVSSSVSRVEAAAQRRLRPV